MCTMKLPLAWLVLLPMATLVEIPAQAQAQAPATPPGCSAGEHRAFDFWIGLWTVTDAAGKFAGINRIESIDGGCVLHEQWTSARGGYTGSSLNWLGADRRWHQTWIDSMGQSLQLVGGLVGHSMVMEGAPKQRITWTPVDADTVRQHWEMSANEGRSWTTAFDGTYRRVRSSVQDHPAGDSLLSRLGGEWIGRGVVMKMDVAVRLTIAPALGGHYTELHWMNLGAEGGGPLFEGRALYAREGDGRYSASWQDSGGGKHAIVATEQGSGTLEALWGTAGRTLYTLLPSGELEVLDSVRRDDGSWAEFGRSRLIRAEPR